jgi:ketosteroid isomerase-like protein
MAAAPLDVVQEIYRRFIFDEDPFELFADDVVWEVPMLDQPEDAFRGHYGVADFFRRWLGTWDYYRIELERAIEAPDGRIVTFFTERAQGKGSGVEVQMKPLGIWTINDGLVSHYKGYLDRDEGLREAGII